MNVESCMTHTVGCKTGSYNFKFENKMKFPENRRCSLHGRTGGTFPSQVAQKSSFFLRRNSNTGYFKQSNLK